MPFGYFRSSRSDVFYKKVLLKFRKIHKKTPVPESLFYWNFIEKESLLWHRCFPVNFAKFSRTPLFTKHLRWLLLLLLLFLSLLNNGWCHSTSNASSYVEDTFKFNATIFSLLFFLFGLWRFSICVFTNNSLLLFDSPKAGSLLSAVKCTLYVLNKKEQDHQEIL